VTHELNVRRRADADILVAKVVASPDHDVARRILADHLLEAGDPHGEYIQVACDAAALPLRDPRRAKLDARAIELQSRHSLAFSRAIRSVEFFNRSADSRWMAPFRFARGFPEHVRGESTEFLAALRRAAGVSPIRAVDLFDARAADVRALASMPELAHVRELNLQVSERSLDGALLELLASPHLERLERLELHCAVTPADLVALAQCPALDGLRALAINFQTGKSFGAIGYSPTMPSEWNLNVDVMLCSGAWATLKTLALCNVEVSAKAIGALGALEELSLTSCRIAGGGAAALADLAPSTLRALTIGNCDVGDPKGLSRVASSYALVGLRELYLYGVLASDALAPFLAMLDRPALESLLAPRSPLRPEGALSFAQIAAKRLPALRTLGLSGAHIEDDGARALAGVELPCLESLNLGQNGIGPAGMAALARGPLLGTVRDLWIENNECGSEGGLELAQAPSVGRLRILDVNGTGMGTDAYRALLEAAANLETLYTNTDSYSAEVSRFLAGSTTRRRLHRLTLRRPDVLAFARTATAEGIRWLSLDYPTIGEDAARALAALPSLETLHLHFPDVGDDARAVLRARFGPNLTATMRRGDVSDWQRFPGPP
jgi:uncharacterized protein (TIGR02996 family)